MTFRSKSKYFINSLLLATFSPLIPVYYAFKNKNVAQQKVAIIVYFIIYGATIYLSGSDDGFQHQNTVYQYKGMSLSDFWRTSIDIINFRYSGYDSYDLYKHFLSYLSGALIGYPPIFFVFVSAIYGFFFINSLYEIFDRPLKHHYFALIAIAFLLVIHKNIEGVNTVRTWTAMWMLIYGVVKFLKYKRLYYLVFVLLTPLIHFAYLIMIIPVIAALFIKGRAAVAMTLFVMSIPFSSFNPTSTLATEVKGAAVLEERVDNYSVEIKETSTEKFSRSTDSNQFRIYKQMQIFGLHQYGFNIVIIITFLTVFRFYKRHTLALNFYVIGTVIHAFSNFSWSIDQVSGRSRVIGEVFILASLFVILRDTDFYKSKRLFKYGANSFLVIMIPFALWNTSRWFDHPSFFSFLTPGVVIVNHDINFSLKQALQYVLPF